MNDNLPQSAKWTIENQGNGHMVTLELQFQEETIDLKTHVHLSELASIQQMKHDLLRRAQQRIQDMLGLVAGHTPRPPETRA